MTGQEKIRANKNNKLASAMGKLRSRSGMTMAEMLLTVAILIILMGLLFVALNAYQKAMAQKERDGYAKEIYFAAQNHLAMARGEGYLQVTEGQNVDAETVSGYTDTADNKIKYFVMPDDGSHGWINDNSPQSIIDLMLPFGSVDETIREGSYIITYQPETAIVLDVFYCSPGNKKFNHTLTSSDYSKIKNLTGKENKSARSDCDSVLGTNNHVILGWYGGGDSAEIKNMIETPTLSVENGEQLKVTVKYNNYQKGTVATPVNGYALKLLITGTVPESDTSDNFAKKAITLVNPTSSVTSSTDKRFSVDGNTITYILDDITVEGEHFADLVDHTSTSQNLGADAGRKLVPGEDIKIQAVAYTNAELSNIGFSEAITVNSLYQSVSDYENGLTEGTTQTSSNGKTAYIGAIRHLENLAVDVSGVVSLNNPIVIKEAKQTDDLIWTDANKAYVGSVQHNFYPITNADLTSYDGMRHSIKGVNVTSGASDNNGGLFGTLHGDAKNLELINFDVSVSGNAGALAGVQAGGTVTNVIAHNEGTFDGLEKVTVESTGGAVGGLIGSAGSSSIRYSGAALVVNGSTAAGGLIGSSGGGAISQCFSGGHTHNGEYYKHTQKNGETVRDGALWNVEASGGPAGGLVGAAGSTTINNSYSTCSVKGSANDNTGGFAGTASGKITNSYCTGLVAHDTKTTGSGANATKNVVNNAFIGGGSLSDDSVDNHYLSVINPVEINNDLVYKGSGAGKTSESKDKVIAMDKDVNTFNNMTGGEWNRAYPYDETLNYKNDGTGVDSSVVRYSFVTVTQLNKGENGETSGKRHEKFNSYFCNSHYGDWPSPEALFINN